MDTGTQIEGLKEMTEAIEKVIKLEVEFHRLTNEKIDLVIEELKITNERITLIHKGVQTANKLIINHLRKETIEDED